MILTCPECATRYSVADDSVGPEGRTVRCANCGLTWRTERDPALTLTAAAPDELGPALRGDELPRAFRERIAAQHRGRRVAASGALWAAAGVGAALLLLLIGVARNDIARAWPKSASAFAAVGLKVNAVGLEIEQRPAQIGFDEQGRPIALVSGVLRNVRGKPVSAPPMRFTLLDAEGRTLAVDVQQPLNAEIPAKAERVFSVRIASPPEPTKDVEVTFDLSGRPAGTAHAKAAPAAEGAVEGGLRPDHGPEAEHADAAH